MLEAITLLIIGIALIFTILAFVTDWHQPQVSAFAFFAFILWSASSAAIISVDVPYSHLYENTDSNAYEVVSGTHTTTVCAPLRWVFMGFGFICLGVAIIMIISQFYFLTKGKEREK